MLEWSSSKKCKQNLNKFELVQSSKWADHFSKLRVNKHRRRNILVHQYGLSKGDLEEARHNTKHMQWQRSMTQVLMPVHLAEEALIGIKNFVKKKEKKRVMTMRKVTI